MIKFFTTGGPGGGKEQERPVEPVLGIYSLKGDQLTVALTDRESYRPTEFKATELARHTELHLQAGMPAEVFITTAPRSLFDYLLEPLGLFARRGLREP